MVQIQLLLLLNPKFSLDFFGILEIYIKVKFSAGSQSFCINITEIFVGFNIFIGWLVYGFLK